MAGDLGYLISPVATGSIAEHQGFPTAYAVAAIPAGIVFLAAMRLPRGIRARSEAEPIELPGAG